MPEGLAVFSLPENHRRRMRTSNPMERAVQQEMKRRTQKVRVFPDDASLTRLVGAVLVEIDDQWAADAKAYINWECQDLASTHHCHIGFVLLGDDGVDSDVKCNALGPLISKPECLQSRPNPPRISNRLA